MINPEYTMMLETFMETAKAQNQELVDGAVFIFIPSGASESNESSVLSWLPDSSKKNSGLVWHDVFMSLLWALLRSGVEPSVLIDMVDHAKGNVGEVRSRDLSDEFECGEIN